MENKTTDIALIQSEINKQVSNPQVMASLMEITFKGLQPAVAKRAMLEAMMRRFSFQDFLDKNVYAIPYGQGYSLVNSIDYNRKVGMRNGIVGVSEPVYVDDESGRIVSCSITIKKKVGDYIGDFINKVYFDEYYTGNKNPDGTVKKNKWGDVKPNLWDTKPRTMIAKVAEMGALRKACPEELSQSYIEEEMEREVKVVIDETNNEKKEETEKSWKQKIEDCKSIEELQAVWGTLPGTLRGEKKVIEVKDIMKTKLTPTGDNK